MGVPKTTCVYRLGLCRAAQFFAAHEDVSHGFSSMRRRIGMPAMCTLACEEDVFRDEGGEMEQRPPHAEEDMVAKAQQQSVGRLARQLEQLSPATPMLRNWLDTGNTIHKRAAIVASQNLMRQSRYKSALEVMDFVRSKWPHQMLSKDHMRRLYLTRQVGTIKDDERCFSEIPKKCAVECVYTQLMSCYVERGMITQAEDAFQKLLHSGCRVSSWPYAQLLSLYSYHRQFDKGLKLVSNMVSAKIKPDTIMLNALLSFTAKADSPAKVLNVYKSMRDAGVAPNNATYIMVIKVYMAAGQQDEAIQTTQEMMKHGPQKNDFFGFQLLLAFYADNRQEEELKRLWNKVQSYSSVTTHAYGVMIESLGKLGLVKEAEDLATKGERKWGGLEAGIFDALMDVYARHGRMEAAEELMVRILKERVRPTSLTYKHLISGHLKAGLPDKALEYLRTSTESGCICYCAKTWLSSLVLVLDYVAIRGEVELAEEIFEDFTEACSSRSTAVYNALLKAYVKANKKPRDFVERIAEDGLEPDVETLEMLSQI